MSDNVNETFPTTYQEWRHCIEDLGQISLTRAFIDKRLTELQDSKNANTEEFAFTVRFPEELLMSPFKLIPEFAIPPTNLI